MKQLLSVIIILSSLLAFATTASAQPAARRGQAQQKAQQKSQQKSGSQAITTRAQISYPSSQEMKEDVVWRRDIYRQVDLLKSENSGLYYPVEPVGTQMNLFTYLFKLVLSGQIKAYEYRVDGNDSFDADDQLKPLSLLDNYHIYYKREDGKLKLDNSDIPSREVKSYYIKESSYFDQASATFHTKVIALCPIMTREDDFSEEPATYPLFWVKYDDVAPFLSKQTIMTSDINNAATMSVDDYFTEHLYKGQIYKTNNMLGQTLKQYCPSDSAMAVEQKKIEGELIAFEENVWGDKARKDSLDSIAKVEAANPKAKKKSARSRRSGATSDTKVSSSKQKSSASSSGNGSAARVSVRRQRH